MRGINAGSVKILAHAIRAFRPDPVDVAPVIVVNAPGITVIAGYGEITHFLGFASGDRQQRLAFHGRKDADAKPFADGGSNIDALDVALDTLAGGDVRSTHHADDVSEFLIEPGACLAHDAMAVFLVAHGFAMIRHNDNNCVFLKAEAVDRIEEFTKLLVDQSYQFRVKHADMVKLFFREHAVNERGEGKEHVLALVIGIIGALLVRIVD